MLFWLFVIILAIGVILPVLSDYDSFGAISLTAIGVVGVCVSLFFLLAAYSNLDGYIDSCNTRYEMLVYQYENNVYENDNDLGKRELIKEIQDWNEGLAYRKSAQDDFWLGIYYPDIYDQFNYISLEGGN